MKKAILLIYILLSGTVIFAQVDSLAAYEAGKGVADVAMDALGAPTPLKLIIHTVATGLFVYIWGRTHRKKKAAKAASENLKG